MMHYFIKPSRFQFHNNKYLVLLLSCIALIYTLSISVTMIIMCELSTEKLMYTYVYIKCWLKINYFIYVVLNYYYANKFTRINLMLPNVRRDNKKCTIKTKYNINIELGAIKMLPVHRLWNCYYERRFIVLIFKQGTFSWQ